MYENIHKVHILLQVLRSNELRVNPLPLQIGHHMSGILTELKKKKTKKVNSTIKPRLKNIFIGPTRTQRTKLIIRYI